MNAPSGLFQRREADRLGRSRSLAVIATICAAVLGACSTNLGNSGANEAALQAPAAPIPENAKPGQPVKIAMLLPLAGMGPAAHVAKSLKQAGEMALFERDNPNVRLIVKDDGGSAEGARLAAEQATRDGAEIILGPLFSQAVGGAAPVARAANVPVIAFSNDPRVAGNGVYLMSFLAKPEVERIVSFAVSKGKRRFASLVPADAYGDTVDPAFRAAVARAGGTLVHADRYPVTANAMIEPVKRVAEAIRQAELAGAPVDALFLPGGQDTLPQLVPLLAYNGIDPHKVKLLGTGAWDYPNVGREQALAGAWYPGPDPRGWQDFSARFARTFGAAPPSCDAVRQPAGAALHQRHADRQPGLQRRRRHRRFRRRRNGGARPRGVGNPAIFQCGDRSGSGFCRSLRRRPVCRCVARPHVYARRAGLWPAGHGRYRAASTGRDRISRPSAAAAITGRRAPTSATVTPRPARQLKIHHGRVIRRRCTARRGPYITRHHVSLP